MQILLPIFSINAAQELQLIIGAKKQLQQQNQKQLRMIDEMKKQLEEQCQRLLRLEDKKINVTGIGVNLSFLGLITCQMIWLRCY